MESLAMRAYWGFRRVLSDKCELVSEWQKSLGSAGAKLLPLDKCGGSVFLVILSAVEMSFLVKMIVNRSMDGCEFL